MNTPANPNLKLSPLGGMLLTPRRMFSAVGLIIFILIHTKLGLAHNLGIWFILPVLLAGYVLLCVISVPVAMAFLITSVQLIAQVSTAHPNVAVFGILSVVVLVALSIIRFREGFLAEFSRLRWPHTLSWTLLAIVFAIGFFGAVQSRDTAWLDFSSGHLLNSLNYVFLGHWLVYIALGILACARLAELKILIIAFSLLYVVAIVPLPLDFYPYFFERIYYECQPMGLHNMTIGGDRIAGSVNRSQVGYLAAMASLISLSLAHHRGGSLGNLFYPWSLLAAVILFLAGSKGPVLGWVIGVFIVMWFANKQERVRNLAVAGVMAAAIGFAMLAGYSPLPCGTVKQYTENFRESFDVRMFLSRGALETNDTAPTAALETNDTAPTAALETNHTARGPWLHLVVGDGFGASARRINPHTGKPLTDSGSHNLFLDLLTDTGFVGLILFLLALSILVRRFVQPLWRQDFPDRRLFMVVAGCTFIVSLIMLLATTSTYREYLGAFLIGLLMGSAVYMGQRYLPSRSASKFASDASAS